MNLTTKSYARSTRQLLEVLESRVLLDALLDPLTQPKFVNPLPLPGVVQPTVAGGTHYEISMSQTQQDLGLVDPVTGQSMLTTVWGYNGSYPGPTIEATTGVPISVHWTNNLVDGQGKPLPHLFPIDTTIDWAGGDALLPTGVPVVPHLHGGHTEAASDGGPDQWFTPGFAQVGPKWVHQTFNYANDQRAATLWYHDHALGATRLNVYAGLAGFYLLRDPSELALNLPAGQFEIPMAIQDRSFNTSGQLVYPSEAQDADDPNPSIHAETFGDFMLVNGKAWPMLDVQPRKYRLRLLNGCDSRFLTLYFSNGQAFSQIGTDQGLLAAPVSLTQLTIAPGERADLVVDFSAAAGQTLILKNNAKTPFPRGDSVDARTTGQVMAFRVASTLAAPDTSSLPASLTTITPLGPADNTRQVLLWETTDEYGRIMPVLGTPQLGMRAWRDPSTENITLNNTEVWEIYNTTMDTHPIHLHLVSFQTLSRQKFKADQDPMTGALSNIRLIGKAGGPAANEAGWKDTVQVGPGEVVRITAKFDLAGEYLWHCHILSHEEHDMMRPLIVTAAPPKPVASAAIVTVTPVGVATADPGLTLTAASAPALADVRTYVVETDAGLDATLALADTAPAAVRLDGDPLGEIGTQVLR